MIKETMMKEGDAAVAALAKRNGPQPPTPKQPPPDEGYRAHVEATVGRYDAVVKERDALQEHLAKAINTLKAASDTETLLRDEIASLRRQLEDGHLRWVQAMAERAAYETLFRGFYAQMRAFNIPAEPLVRDLSRAAQIEE